MSFLVSRKIANEELSIETGKLAFQSDSSVVINVDVSGFSDDDFCV